MIQFKHVQETTCIVFVMAIMLLCQHKKCNWYTLEALECDAQSELKDIKTTHCVDGAWADGGCLTGLVWVSSKERRDEACISQTVERSWKKKEWGWLAAQISRLSEIWLNPFESSQNRNPTILLSAANSGSWRRLTQRNSFSPKTLAVS